jgi:Putative transposase/Transposase zinc-binding domain
MAATTLRHILDVAFPAYAAVHRLPLRVHKAVSVLRRCRTGGLGWHARRCCNGHVVDVRLNSCRHRVCPQCGWHKREDWVQRWQAKLLPTTHFQVIFTVASELHGLWRWNRQRFADACFEATRATVFQLLGQARHLGARPGLLLALHTWGSALPIHLHVHGLLTAGGVDAEGKWVATRPNFLIWGPILRDVFRDHLLAALRELLHQGLLYLPPRLTVADVHALLDKLEHIKWHVRIEPPYANGKGLVIYLARYLRGGPIKNHRLLGFTGTDVCFRYRQYRGPQPPRWRTMVLPVEEFLDRLFEHVPVKGLHMVRAYGLYNRSEHVALERCRAQLDPHGFQPLPQAPAAIEPDRCPRCGAALTLIVSRTPVAPGWLSQKPTGPGPPLRLRSN